MGVIICEHKFKHEDPEKFGYAFHELDFFTTYRNRLSFRLSLRKNLEEKRYEVYKHYSDYHKKEDLTIFFSNDLQTALDYGWDQFCKIHPDMSQEEKDDKDKACLHNYEQFDFMCPILKKKEDQE